MARKAPAPNVEHNLAEYRWGPTLSASSYYRDPGSHHHPVFLVDGQRAPSPIEKWASAASDRAPWVEITWAEPRTISRVVVQHVGAYESLPNLSRYTLRCLTESALPTVLEVRDNQQAVARHAMACPGARGLRAQWHLAKGEDSARVYEIEVWGR